MEWLRKSPSLSGGRNSNSGLVVFPQWWHCRRGQLCSRGTTTDLCLVLCAGAQPSDITGVMFPAHSLCDSQGPAGPGLPPMWPLPPLSPHVHCQQPKLTVTHSLTWILSRPSSSHWCPAQGRPWHFQGNDELYKKLKYKITVVAEWKYNV